MNIEFDNEFDPELSNLTPQQILNHLSKTDKDLSGNPYEIMKAINTFGSPKFTSISDTNDEILDIVGSYDYLTSDEKSGIDDYFEADSTNTKTLNIHEILDEILTENDTNAIKFGEDQENIFETENLTIEKLESYKEDFVLEKDIPQRIIDPNKKIGSVKQKTILVSDLYPNGSLLFRDESEDLFLILRNKLLIYWDVIVDFEDTVVSDTFLKYTFGDLCRWLTPKEILQRVTIANITDELYVTLIKVSLPNMYKSWINTDGILEQNESISNMELYRTLNPDEKIELDEFRTEKLSDTAIPFEKISAEYLGKKREKKLKYPVFFVEKVTGEVIKNYKVDDIITDYISTVVDHKIDWEQVKLNSKKNNNDESYVIQFGKEEFDLIYSFVQDVLLDKCYSYLEHAKDQIVLIKDEMKEIKASLPKEFVSRVVSFQTIYAESKVMKKVPDHIRFKLRRLEELEFALMDLEHKYFIKEDILKNVFEIISFSMYKTGLDKVKLIAYHFLAKHIEKISEKTWEELPSKKIRGHVTIIEMFRYEMIGILQDDDNLKKFVFTIKELILKWVYKYTMSSAMARVYFDFMMMTPELMAEMILRYIALIAVKNKNPMTLRAIYSSYISLIHTSIYLTINSNVYDRKYGFFKALEKHQSEDYQYNKEYSFPADRKVYANTILRTHMLKNPKLLNDNYFLMKRLSISSMLELNSLRIYATKPKKLPIHDWWYFYIRFFQHLDKGLNYKIKSKFIKPDKRNSQMNYISLITYEILREPLYKRVKDYDCVEEILEVISNDISMRTINRGYMDKNLKLIVKSNTEYLDYIYDLLNDIKNNLEN